MNDKERNFEMLWIKAKLAGMDAGRACTPTPMRVVEHMNMADDDSPERRHWDVPSGVCGFASIVIRPATSSFARWLKKYEGPHGTYKDYYGGLAYSIGDYGQSFERKEAHARAMMRVLAEAGIDGRVDSRLD